MVQNCIDRHGNGVRHWRAWHGLMPTRCTLQLNTALSQFPNNYGNRVFGALSFREADTTAAAFDYTIHVSEHRRRDARGEGAERAIALLSWTFWRHMWWKGLVTYFHGRNCAHHWLYCLGCLLQLAPTKHPAKVVSVGRGRTARIFSAYPPVDQGQLQSTFRGACIACRLCKGCDHEAVLSGR